MAGFALEPESEPNLFGALGLSARVSSKIGDVRDFASFKEAADAAGPQVLFYTLRLRRWCVTATRTRSKPSRRM